MFRAFLTSLERFLTEIKFLLIVLNIRTECAVQNISYCKLFIMFKGNNLPVNCTNVRKVRRITK